MNLTNDEKLMLAPILDRAETWTRKEREGYLRSADVASQLHEIAALTTKLQLIEKLQFYCTKMEGVVKT